MILWSLWYQPQLQSATLSPFCGSLLAMNDYGARRTIVRTFFERIEDAEVAEAVPLHAIAIFSDHLLAAITGLRLVIFLPCAF